MNSLDEVSKTLKSALGSDALFALINTRISLRTGVDLTNVSAAENDNPEIVGKVLETLATLGFPAKNLLLVAQKAKHV